MELKVRKFGNSLGRGAAIEKVIHRLRTENGERLFLIEDAEGGYRLTPYDPAFEQEKMQDPDNSRAGIATPCAPWQSKK